MKTTVEAIVVKDVAPADIQSSSEARSPGQYKNNTKRTLAGNPSDHENTEFTARHSFPYGKARQNDNDNQSNHLPSPQRNLNLPDLDDVSINFLFHHMEHYEEDLLFSSLSDYFF
jgi:hypothetical protein